MITAISVCAVTCLLMILAVLFYPKLKIGKVALGTYWVITLIGAAVLLLFKIADGKAVLSSLLADTSINPLKILVLFISMTVLSIYLDELGFFRFLAAYALKRAGTSQTRLFFILYITVSVLTVFTSNDIIILSFTPFICYFAKNANISPIPYLSAEFVAANTWSMALIIGNPTNIYLVTAAGGDFMSYLKIMLLPTLASGTVAFILLFLLFRKRLSERVCAVNEDVVIKDKFSLWVGIIHLAVCTVVLAIGSYIGIEMWLVSFASAISLFLWNIGISIFRKSKPQSLVKCLRRAPWELIPFILSMFVMIESLRQNGVTDQLANILGADFVLWKNGISSFFAANLINNIPMSVLYSSILENVNSDAAVYATVVGSNLGACLTPIGALAGIMWVSILKEHKLKYSYFDFLKTGVTVAIPALLTALLTLQVILK